MNRAFYAAVFAGILFSSGALIVAQSDRSQSVPNPLPYHSQPPTESLPSTLDAAQFRNQHAAFVAYSLAPRIDATLYQIPCYCPCRKIEGHTSLLECFVGTHGVKCAVCQKELLFCFRERRRKTPMELREGIAHGKAWKIDLQRDTEKLYRRLTEHPYASIR